MEKVPFMKPLRNWLSCAASAFLVGWMVLAGASAHAALVDAAAFTKGVTSCDGGACMWSLAVDGVDVMSGMYQADAEGNLSVVPGQMTRVDLEGGGFISLDGVSGNIDPILGFNASAGTAGAGRTFAFSFSLPIALSGTIQANSSVSYSLTAVTAAGAQIDPLFGKVVTAQEVDTTPGGLSPLNKGVDVGNRFFFVGGPQTQNSPVYTASNQFTGDLAYDTMSATIAFSLSPNSQVGLSGFVQQVEPLPEPDTYLLLGAGLLSLGFLVRGKQGS